MRLSKAFQSYPGHCILSSSSYFRRKPMICVQCFPVKYHWSNCPGCGTRSGIWEMDHGILLIHLEDLCMGSFFPSDEAICRKMWRKRLFHAAKQKGWNGENINCSDVFNNSVSEEAPSGWGLSYLRDLSFPNVLVPYSTRVYSNRARRDQRYPSTPL